MSDTKLPPIYVISLADEDQRRAEMSDKLSGMGISFTFFDAIDGRGFSVDEYPHYHRTLRRLTAGRDLTGGEVGCYLSHKAVMERMLENGDERALILEDDVIFRDDFVSVIQALIKKCDHWHFVRFLGSPKVERSVQRRFLKLHGEHYLTRLKTTPSGAHAYLIDRSAAKRLLQMMQRNAYPVDVLMGRSWRTGLGMLSVMPGIAVHDEEAESAIGDKRFDKSLRLSRWERLIYPITRALYKLDESLKKQYAYLAASGADKKILRETNAE